MQANKAVIGEKNRLAKDQPKRYSDGNGRQTKKVW